MDGPVLNELIEDPILLREFKRFNLHLQRHQVNVFVPKSDAAEMTAYKCFKTELKANTFGFLSIYKRTEAEVGNQINVPEGECRKAALEKKVEEKKLEEISPGFFGTDSLFAIRNDNISWFGSKQSMLV
ncbi:unnamed protein product [Caenorhabditis nigoni]